MASFDYVLSNLFKVLLRISNWSICMILQT